MAKRNRKLTHNTLQWIMDWADHCKTDYGYNWTKHDDSVYEIVKKKQTEYNRIRNKKHLENTHSCCNKRLKEEGGKTRCCYCVPHNDCEINK